MLLTLKSCYKKYFSHPEAIWLALFLILGFSIIIFLGDILAPIFISLIVVYLIEWFVSKLAYFKIPRFAAYGLTYLLFLATLVFFILILLLLWKQIINLFSDLPAMVNSAKAALVKFMENYTNFLPNQQIDTLVSSILLDIQNLAKRQVSSSLNYISGIITWLVYLFLIPLIVFFFLKDRNVIIAWFNRLIPKKIKALKAIIIEMDRQIGNYVRGKILQIFIVGIFNGIIFLYFKLNYAILLAAAVGISVIVPYVGAVLATIPVIFVGYLQWGFNQAFAYMFVSYLIIQFLDGNILVPILFSKAVNLHPIAIVTAILFFGSLWGFLGIVFAIPLAILIKTVGSVWPVAKIKSKT